MDNLNKIKKNIQDVREKLNKLVESKDTVNSKELIELSEKLDELINQYARAKESINNH